ncbi:alpha/beta fold hydrolase [Ovoidimarina sediminis]|uniref:alpha/beta fold hydrolase n=1 Tax=Ovoidimarina sediminis TaxID=3079856 RepID=UPI002909277D|nr:alpha/beta fold hydrolase [Rhodophyticola sp. MJ-SS7]MDU8946422.1 alpha/beta fold hydrolase [Rhodophyticola sp. MJ-SS7]
MAEAILVPQVGQDLTEATVVELHVKLGDTVKKGDLVAVVESEKASFEVEAFAEGVVISLPFKEGDTATVLEPLMHLGAEGETVEEAARPVPAEAAAAAEAPEPAAAEAEPVAAPAPAMATASGVLRASPIARRRAAEHGLDIARLQGTGPVGAVVLKDVARALEAGAGAPATAREAITLKTLRDGQGSPIVFIHGFGADLSSWRPMVGQLPVGLPIMALDLPGHGGSVENGAQRFEEIVETVGQALYGISGGIHLVGHSLGGAVAAVVTERGDLDVRSLTLISPAGMGAYVDGAFVDGFLSAQSEPALAAWMRRLVYDPASLAPVLVRATLAARENPLLVEAQRAVARGVFEGSTQLFSIGEALRRFRGPCTVITGREDAILSMRDVEAGVPANVALHRVPGTGHLPQLEAADLVQTLITRTVRAAG